MWMKPQIYFSRERHERLHCFVKQTWYNSSLEAEWSSFECYLSTSSSVFKVVLHQPSWPLRNRYKQSCRGRGFALQGIRAHAPKPGCEILLVRKFTFVTWPLVSGRFQSYTVHSKYLPVVFRSSTGIKHLTKTSQLQVLLIEHDQLGTLILMKLFCTTLQLKFTTILCNSRRPTAKSWQRAHAGAAVSHVQPCEGRGTSRAPCWCHPAGQVPCSTCAPSWKGESCPELLGDRQLTAMQTNQWLLVCRCSPGMQINLTPFSHKFQCRCAQCKESFFHMLFTPWLNRKIGSIT